MRCKRIYKRLGLAIIIIIGLLALGSCDSDDRLISDSDKDLSENNNNNETVLSKHAVLLVISFDGFRFDFFKKIQTPNLDLLKLSGVSVPYMRNQFVTKTFPNHMSIATGLHPESHGVTDNWLFDPYYNKILNSTMDLFWNYENQTLPLWTLNELAGEGRRSGVMMWPGSDMPYGPNFTMPSRVEKWNDTMPFNLRVDKVVDWITDKTNPVNLVFMYFEEPDEVAHGLGPESENVTRLIQKLDNTTGYLIDKLKAYKIFDKVNLIFLSDHGFQEIKQKDMINISSIVSKDLYDQYGSTPVIQLLPKPGNLDEVYVALKKASEGNNFSVYKKEDMIPSWHYSDNRRIMPIVLVAQLGFVFEDFERNIQDYNKKFDLKPSPDRVYGVHGYDNRVLPMHPFFISHGPVFKRKFIAEPFDNIDLFPLICKIMKIETPPNNGTIEHVRSLLFKKGFSASDSPVGWAIGAGLVFGVMILLGIMSLLVASRSRQRNGRSAFNAGNNGDSGYRFINRRGSLDSIEGADGEDTEEEIVVVNPGKEEYQALLMSSSTEEI